MPSIFAGRLSLSFPNSSVRAHKLGCRELVGRKLILVTRGGCCVWLFGLAIEIDWKDVEAYNEPSEEDETNEIVPIKTSIRIPTKCGWNRVEGNGAEGHAGWQFTCSSAAGKCWPIHLCRLSFLDFMGYKQDMGKCSESEEGEIILIRFHQAYFVAFQTFAGPMEQK